MQSTRKCAAAHAVAVLLLLFGAALASAQHYTQTNLVSDIPGLAKNTDPNLVNPWGIARSTPGVFWVGDNGTGVSTLYDGDGNIIPAVFTVPPPSSSKGPATPTGTIFNGSSDFAVAPGKPAIFIFVTEDGTVSGWNPGANPGSAILKYSDNPASVFKGATIALNGKQRFLYAANFRKARVDIFDTNFRLVRVGEHLFEDAQLPAGYAPFNIQSVGGNLYVGFAKQDAEKHDEVDGPGLGYVDVFDVNGKLLLRLQHGSFMNAPWGMTLAAQDFGSYSHDILVGQFGSGHIDVFDPVTGRFKDFLRDADAHVITIDGLWGLSFGNGASAGASNALYFAAGINHEQDGLFGVINVLTADLVQGNDQ